MNFKVTQAALIAFLNDSAHYFQLYSSPLHGALPYPYRASTPSLLSFWLRPGMCSTNHLSLNAGRSPLAPTLRTVQSSPEPVSDTRRPSTLQALMAKGVSSGHGRGCG